MEVLKSPDPDLILGELKLFFEKIRIGRNVGEILIDDKLLKSPHLILELNDHGLFVEPTQQDLYYLVNHKRIKGRKFLGPGDILSIGESDIKITNYIFDKDLSQKEMIKSNLKLLLEEDSPVNEILDILEEDLKELNRD